MIPSLDCKLTRARACWQSSQPGPSQSTLQSWFGIGGEEYTADEVGLEDVNPQSNYNKKSVAGKGKAVAKAINKAAGKGKAAAKAVDKAAAKGLAAVAAASKGKAAGKRA